MLQDWKNLKNDRSGTVKDCDECETPFRKEEILIQVDTMIKLVEQESETWKVIRCTPDDLMSFVFGDGNLESPMTPSAVRNAL
ncbi:hypothetical protein H2248_008963 [Termitomyces sp. 'cryptogamus']|nr:hypothetical protein H2248_008963 [Termitomyces sp. 'cryptogamus']